MTNIRKIMPHGVGKPQQVHSDAVPLYLEAAEVKPAFDRVVRVEIQKQYSKLCDGEVGLGLGLGLSGLFVPVSSRITL